MIKIAMLQIRTETDQAETMEKARRMVYEAADKGVDLRIGRIRAAAHGE